jgi:hypothetical protein
MNPILPVTLWIDKRWSLFCCGVLLFTLIQPPEGFPFRLCLIHLISGIDCPGCGITRGMSHFWRGDWRIALALHPFSPVIFIYLCVQALVLVVPKPYLEWGVQLLTAHSILYNRIILIGGSCFLTFGLFRASLQSISLGKLPESLTLFSLLRII